MATNVIPSVSLSDIGLNAPAQANKKEERAVTQPRDQSSSCSRRDGLGGDRVQRKEKKKNC